MALKYFDRVKETSVTTGTGNILLGGAEAGGFRAFASVLNDGDQFYYTAQNVGPGEWETGIGTYVFSANAISRTLVKSSSNANALVNFSAGNKDVALTPAAEFFTSPGPLNIQGLTGATAASRWVGGTALGPPTSGTFLAGDWVTDQTGDIWVCVVGGTPGTWSDPATDVGRFRPSFVGSAELTSLGAI